MRCIAGYTSHRHRCFIHLKELVIPYPVPTLIYIRKILIALLFFTGVNGMDPFLHPGG
jgi:hypothetical protein